MSQTKKSVRKSSFGQSIKMVAWSFLGIRQNSDFQEDMAKVSLFHVIAVGIAGAFIFVVGLIALVNWVVAK